MSSLPPFIQSDVFNPNLLTYASDALDITIADKRYIRIGGDAYLNTAYINGSIDAGSYKLSGTIVDFSTITGITNGTAAASKALVVDASRNITNVASLTSTSLTTSTLNLNGSFNFGSNLNTTMNNNLIITGSASSPTATNGLGFAFSPIPSAGRIKCYNYITSSWNSISINDDAIYVNGNANKYIGINTNAPQTNLHVNGNTRITSYLQVGTSTDTARMISCLSSSMTNGTSRFITLGKADSASNQAEISYYHSSDGSSDNRLTLGLHTMPIMHIRANGSVGIGKTTAEGGTFDCSSHINTDGAYRMDGTDVITASRQFIGNGGVLTSGDVESSGRIRCRNDAGMHVFSTTYPSNEARMYCGLGYAYIGMQNNGMLLMGTNNETFITCRKDSGGRKATCIGGGSNTNFMLSVEGSDLYRYVGAYGWFNSNGNAGTGNDTNSANVAFYCNGRALCVGEIDCISDRRRKRDIDILDDNWVNLFIDLGVPKQFKYIKEGEKLSYGYIAQELYKSGFETLIDVSPNEEMKEEIDDDGFINPEGAEFSVSTGSIIPILHRKIQMMDEERDVMLAKIEEQQMIIEQLNESIDELYERINTLSNIVKPNKKYASYN